MNPYTNRWTLESIGSLEPRQSVLEDDFEEEEEKEENDQLDGLEDGAREKVLISHLSTQILCLIKGFGGRGKKMERKTSAISCSEVKLGGKGIEKGKGRKGSFFFLFLFGFWGGRCVIP